MDWLSNMALFVEVVRTRGFQRAALNLDMPVSTLSRRISAFEKQLGMKLLHRTTRKVEPTHEGLSYFNRCAPLVDEARLAHEELAGLREGVSGVLRVSCTPDFAALYLHPMLEQFLQDHPKLRLHLDMTVRRVDLLSESVDVALRLGRLEDSSLVARPLGHFSAGLFASPNYLAQQGHPTEPQDLAHMPCLRMVVDGSLAQWTLTSMSHSVAVQTVAVQGRVAVNSMQMLVNFCQSGYGIGLIDLRAAAPGLEQGRLVRVLPQWKAVGSPLHMVTASRLQPARVRVFGEALQRFFKAP